MSLRVKRKALVFFFSSLFLSRNTPLPPAQRRINTFLHETNTATVFPPDAVQPRCLFMPAFWLPCLAQRSPLFARSWSVRYPLASELHQAALETGGTKPAGVHDECESEGGTWWGSAKTTVEIIHLLTGRRLIRRQLSAKVFPSSKGTSPRITNARVD